MQILIENKITQTIEVGTPTTIFTFQKSYNFLSVKNVYITLLKIFIHVFTYFWLCWVIVAGSRGYTPVVVFPLQWLLLLWETDSRPPGFSSWRVGSVVGAHGLGCSRTCGIFPDQGSNHYPLH